MMRVAAEKYRTVSVSMYKAVLPNVEPRFSECNNSEFSSGASDEEA